jgi:uncharacterized membrane protein YfcA
LILDITVPLTSTAAFFIIFTKFTYMYSEKEMMMKPHTIPLTLALIIMFCNAVEGGAHLNKGILSRKTLKERKLITTGVSPALGGFLGQISSNTDAGQINRNADSAKTEALMLPQPTPR